MQYCEEKLLSAQEKKEILYLRVKPSISRSVSEGIYLLSFAQAVLKDRKIEKEKKNSDYLDLPFIPPASKLKESLAVTSIQRNITVKNKVEKNVELCVCNTLY